MADKTIRGPFGVEKGITTDNIGTVASGTSVVEYGNGAFHQTVITVDTTLSTISATTLRVGKLIYTFPDGAVDVKATYMSMALTTSGTSNTADTPDIGIGTVIGTGSSATLNGGTMENIITGQTADDCNGTAEVLHQVTSLVIATAGAHTVYFNAADTWVATDTACAIAGTIIIEWTFVV